MNELFIIRNDYAVFTQADAGPHDVVSKLKRLAHTISLKNKGGSELSFKIRSTSAKEFADLDPITVGPGETEAFSGLGAHSIEVTASGDYELRVY